MISYKHYVQFEYSTSDYIPSAALVEHVGYVDIIQVLEAVFGHEYKDFRICMFQSMQGWDRDAFPKEWPRYLVEGGETYICRNKMKDVDTNMFVDMHKYCNIDLWLKE